MNKVNKVSESELANYSKEDLMELVKELQSKPYGIKWESFEEPVEPLVQSGAFQLCQISEKGIEQASLVKEEPHWLIEGENLGVLHSLLPLYEGKVDCILIDPPYFSQNNTLRYKDTFHGKQQEWRHSRWIDFMAKRLELAKQLLSERGLLLAHIDEKEVAHLRLLLDDIMGESSFVSMMVWQNRYGLANDKNGITSQTEYILVYVKNPKFLEFAPLPLNPEYVEKTYKNPDNDPRGRWRSIDIHKPHNPRSYEVVSPTGKTWCKPWNYKPESFQKLIEEDCIYWGKDGNSIPRRKAFLENSKGVKPKNLLLGNEYGYTQNGSKELEQILHDKTLFLYPKPLALTKHLLYFSTQSDSLVLDFFAGSGTTGHAILELNQEDGGNRRFILVNNDENHICEEVTYERLKRVMTGYTSKNGEAIDGLGGELHYFRWMNPEQEE